jgi:hypothetical protein
MMKLKETIHTAVNQMNMSELVLLYEHIRLVKEMKQSLSPKRADTPIEKILEMTASSGSCWSDTVIQERADRI